MANIYQKLLFIVALIVLPVSGWCQSGEINIRFIGNCGLYLTDGKADIYIDFPYKSGAHNYMEYDPSEIANIKPNATFIFTHEHADHYSKKLLKKTTGQKYGPWNIEEIKNIEAAIPEFSIESFRTPHKVFGISFEHYSYLIVWHNKRIFVSGDTESPDTVAKMEHIDWLFAPAWLLMDAKEKNLKIDAVKTAVYHIGPKDNITSNDPKIYLLNKQGDVISIPF